MKTYPIDSTFTVKDLMQVLEDMDPLAPVRAAVHPLLPFEVAGIPFPADR